MELDALVFILSWGKVQHILAFTEDGPSAETAWVRLERTIDDDTEPAEGMPAGADVCCESGLKTHCMGPG